MKYTNALKTMMKLKQYLQNIVCFLIFNFLLTHFIKCLKRIGLIHFFLYLRRALLKINDNSIALTLWDIEYYSLYLTN